MISTVADLLENFKKHALSKIECEDQNITHTVAIGDNFEGLTAELLNKAIFKDLKLKMVERSFVYNDSGVMSNELDCMLVVGEGERMSFANRYKYHIKDVIAVIQVKKNLYANDIIDSFDNLRSIIKVSEPRDADSFVGVLHRDAYKLLTLKELPDKERRSRFTDREDHIYAYIAMEAFYPLRIIIGYYGYTTEHGFREGFVKKIEEISKNGPVRGYGPNSFPSLIICGNTTIIKNNGMPMGIPLTNEDFYFHILMSSNGKSMYHLLELIWTRLAYKFGISAKIFGDSFALETVHPFLSCKEKQIDQDNWGWEYLYHTWTKEELSKAPVLKLWEPIEIDRQKYLILNDLLRVGTIDLHSDEQFRKFIDTEKLDAERIIQELSESHLVYVDEGKLRLLVDQLCMVETPEGKIFAGENKCGEMASYFCKHNL